MTTAQGDAPGLIPSHALEYAGRLQRIGVWMTGRARTPAPFVGWIDDADAVDADRDLIDLFDRVSRR